CSSPQPWRRDRPQSPQESPKQARRAQPDPGRRRSLAAEPHPMKAASWRAGGTRPWPSSAGAERTKKISAHDLRVVARDAALPMLWLIGAKGEIVDGVAGLMTANQLLGIEGLAYRVLGERRTSHEGIRLLRRHRVDLKLHAVAVGIDII